MFAVSLLVFTLLLLSPGSMLATLIGTRPSTPQMIAELTARYRLDDPFPVRYGAWLQDVLQGDLGRSTQSGAAVVSVIGDRLPVTLGLAGYALLLVLVVGIPAGMLAGIRRGGRLDRGVSGLAVVGMSALGFAVGILLIYLFGVRFALFPVFGAGNDDLVDRVSHLTLPAVALGTGLAAIVVRQTRAAVLDVMRQDYITFARARGLSRRRTLVQYALRNTALPVVTAAGLLLITAVSGAVLVETVFSLPGLGNLMIQSVNAKDVPVVQGLTLVVGGFVVLVNLLVDLLMLLIDPRTRSATRG
ncbi:ABC transporter permease [Pseudonocardia sp. HH130630-07]|nr:ABC transporter permease [Pseudonocardia sp. HH130630-07]